MHSPDTFLASTRSAVAKLLGGLDDYRRAFGKGIEGSTFVSDGSSMEDFDARYRQWRQDNPEIVERSIAAQTEFHGERFARATLAGAVLELAWKGIEVYSTNTRTPASVRMVVGDSKVGVKFALGREIRGVPIGLVIYAARNQHVHYNDRSLARINRDIIEQMARHGHPDLKSPELDLDRHQGESLANNMIYLLDWVDLARYERDMRALLSPFDE